MAVSIAQKEYDDLTQKRDSLDKIKASVEKIKGLIRELTSLNSRLETAQNKETKAEGEPLALHYAYSMSDQLTGDYSIDPAIFA